MQISFIDDGEYIGKLTDLTTKQSTNGYEYLEWRFVIEDSDAYAGTPIVKRSFGTSEKAKRLLHDELEKLGIKARTGEEFEAEKHAIVGRRIRITVQQNDNGTYNVYIQGMADGKTKSLW